MIGLVLNDRYVLEEKIGGGGMAYVYKAHDNKLGREVAVKILKQEFVDDEDFVENFKKESHSAARLNHPNIVGVFDVGMDEIEGQKNYYIVMEIVKGKTLKELIMEKGRLSVPETLYYSIQISESLLCAHENGIIHRDIKPQNIIINQENLAKVTDFGIAQGANRGNTVAETDILGSVHYFSPEQAKGEGTDERSDIYSLGIVMYEMLTGEVPFDGENPISVALKQVQEPIKLPSTINHEVPAVLDNIILKMTNKDPKERYSSLTEVISNLKAFEKKNDLENSDTLIIPNVNRIKKDMNVSADDQRRIRRSALESSSSSRAEYKSTSRKNSNGGGILSILGGIITALIVASLGFFLFFKFFMLNTPSKAKDVTVPNIIGLQEDTARKTIEDLGLKFEIKDRLINREYNPGDVIWQSVDEGQMVKKGYTVRVSINALESGNIEIDNYVGLKLEDAIKQIDKRDIKVELDYKEVEDEKDYNKVIEQDLRPGTMVQKGSIIKLVVGKEKDVETIKMPDLLGINLERAKEVLKEKGLVLGQITDGESDNFDDDDIIGQSVEKDEEVEKGTTINLVKNVKPKKEKPEEEPEEEPKEDNENENEEENNTTPPTESTTQPDPPSGDNNLENYTFNINFKVPSTKDSYKIKIDKVQNNTSTTVYTETHKAGDSVSLEFKGTKDAVFQIHLDGLLIDTETQ